MNTRCKTATSVTVAIIVFAMVFSSINLTPASGVLIPREKTVWAAGFGQGPTRFQPWNTGDQGWDTYMMYEPMFGTNVATGELIRWLGKDITWLNNSTIQITLRSDAKWTDGSAITTDDVIFSFAIMEQQNQTAALCDFVGKGRLGGKIASTFEKVNATVLKVHINNATYQGSSEVYRQLTYSYLIFPKSVWSVINATYCKTTLAGLSDFANDWQPASMNFSWKVASGMFLPYWHDLTTTITQRNNDWWGKDDPDFGRLPNVEYMGYTAYASNDLALLALERGDLDWCGKYIAALDTVMAAYPNVVTYFPNSPYFADKALKYLVPNAKNYPLNQSWLHKAISTVMDYDGFSALSSGYLKHPSPMYIPADDAAARATLNTTIEAQYAVNLNPSVGLAILSQYCNYDSVKGVWWTKQGVTPSDPIKHYPLAQWPGKGGDNSTLHWTILNFYGWTDVDTIDFYAAQAINASLNIKMGVDQGPGNGWGVVQARVNSGAFDFYDHVMAGQINMNMYERYFQVFSPKAADAGGTVKAPLGGYYNATLVGLIDELDTKTAGSAAQWAIANKIQNILGQEMPYIPMAGHPDWQIYSTTYWSNWPKNGTNPMLPGSPYAGITQNANNLAILWGLTPTGVSGIGIPTEVLLLAVGVVVVVAVIAVAAVLLRRKK